MGRDVMRSQPKRRTEHIWGKGRGCCGGSAGWVKQGLEVREKLLLYPGGSGESLRIFEQDNYRPPAQKG